MVPEKNYPGTAAINQRPVSDDIDLLRLLENSLSFLNRYKWVFTGALVCGLALGLLAYSAIATTYRSRAVIHSFVLTNQEQIQIVNNWNQLLKKKEYDRLAELLGTPKEILYQTKELKAKEIQQVYTPQNPNGFTIDALVTDNTILPELQQGIVYGFENSEYIRERLAVKRQGLKELIATTTTEIQKLDSTKRSIERIIGGQRSTSSSLIIDGGSVNRQLIEMNEKLLSFKESLQFSNAVQVLQSFSAFKKPDGPKLSAWLFIGLAAGLSLGYCFALLHSVIQKLKRRRLSPVT